MFIHVNCFLRINKMSPCFKFDKIKLLVTIPPLKLYDDLVIILSLFCFKNDKFDDYSQFLHNVTFKKLLILWLDQFKCRIFSP